MSVAGNPPTAGEFARGATVFGRFMIDRCMRRDRLASVFAARDRAAGDRPVAVWAARGDQLTRRVDSAERFVAEMKRVAAAEHPSLPRLLAYDFEREAPLAVTELKAGRSLRDVIASEPFVPIEDVTRVATSVGAALTALHGARPPLVHLGVCPERVLFGDDGRVWLEESGFLHALFAAGLLNLSQGFSFAQPGYALPGEFLHAFDPAADVFLLAVTAFEALTGQLPFGAAAQHELEVALRGSYLPSAAALRPGLPPEVDDVFEHAWRSGSSHPATADGFARDLLRIIGGDRSLRPTFPGATIEALRLQATRPKPITTPQPPGTAAASPDARDAVDRAFDDMLQGAASPPRPASNPPFIEFTPLDPGAAARETPGAAPVVDVTPVKPTLVGATGVRLATYPPPDQNGRPKPSERPAVHDVPTPSVGYERLRLLAEDAAHHGAEAKPPAAQPPADPERGPPDMTTQIEDGLLDALRRSTLAGVQPSDAPGALREQKGAEGPSPRVRNLRALPKSPPPRRASYPPPPGATRPSATPPGTRSPRPPPLPAADRAHPHADDHHDHHPIPPPPRLPTDAMRLVSEAPAHAPAPSEHPSVAASFGPEVADIAPDEALPVSELSASYLVEAEPTMPGGMTRAEARERAAAEAARAREHAAAESSLAHAKTESTQLTGTPVPPRAVVPPALREPAPDAAHRPEPASPRPPAHAAPPAPAPERRPAAVRASAPSPERHSAPAPERVSVPRVDVMRPTEPPPVPAPLDSGWATAARWLSVSTVVSALLVTAGFAYMRSSIDGLRDDLARYRAESADAGAPSLPAVPPPDADALAARPDAAAPPTDVVAVPPDAAAPADVFGAPDVAPVPDVAAAPDVAPADAAARPLATPAGGVPDESVRLRLSAQMRGAVSDCVEGVEESRAVVVGVRYDPSGAVTRVRLHGIFQEPPLGPCIEEAVRNVRAPSFPAPFWETEFRFPVPPPRWRPGGGR